MDKAFFKSAEKFLHLFVMLFIFFISCRNEEKAAEIIPDIAPAIIFKVKAELNYVWFNGGTGGHINYRVKEVLKGDCNDSILDIGFFGRNYFRDINSYCRDLYYRNVILEKRVFFDSAFHYSAEKKLVFDSIKRKADTALFVVPGNKGKSDYPDLSKVRPVEFLQFLRNKNLACMVLDDSLLKHTKNWIKPEDLDTLVKLIESKEPVIPVYDSYCIDNIYSVYSTVGREALFLIEGFRKGKYPPAASSIRMPDKEYNYFETRPVKPGTYLPDKNKIAETKTWWKNNKTKYLK